AKPDSELFLLWRRIRTQQPKSLDIEPFQTTFFFNLMTVLQLFGVPLDNLIYLNDAMKKSIEPEAGFVLSISYLFHQVVTGQATEKQKQEFWNKCITCDSALDREWLELSGLGLLQPK